MPCLSRYSRSKIEILESFAVADKVVVHDRVTGRPDGKTADEITVYQVQDGRITNIVYVEQNVRDEVPKTR